MSKDCPESNIIIERHKEAFKQSRKCNIHYASFMMFGAIQRSLWNYKALHQNIDSNYFVSCMILRSQMDTLMRLNALNIHPEPDKVAEGVLMKKKKFSDFFIEENNKKKLFRDFFLKSKISEEFTWFEKVYDNLSGIVHFSDIHSRCTWEKNESKNQEKTINIRLYEEEPSIFSEENRNELQDCMNTTTELILDMAENFFQNTKHKF